jgi:hypothetical protein
MIVAAAVVGAGEGGTQAGGTGVGGSHTRNGIGPRGAQTGVPVEVAIVNGVSSAVPAKVRLFQIIKPFVARLLNRL